MKLVQFLQFWVDAASRQGQKTTALSKQDEALTRFPPALSARNRMILAVLTMIAFSNCVRLFMQGSTTILSQSFDTGWIVRAGEYIIHCGPPQHDVFSWTSPERNWIAYQWLFESFSYLVFQTGGLWLLGLCCCIATGVLYLYVLPAIWARKSVPLLVSFSFLALVLTPHWFNVRPQILSYFLILLLISILERNRRSSTRLIWTVPFIAALWANVHTFWLFGLGIVFIYTICAFFSKHTDSRRTMPVVLILSLVAICINPYGFNLLTYVFSFFNGSQFLGMTEALPSYADPTAHFVLAYLALTWIILIRNRKKLSLEGFLVAALVTLAALAVRRYQSVAVIAIWPYLGQVLADSIDWRQYLKGHNWLSATSFNRYSSACLFAASISVSAVVWTVNVPNETAAVNAYCENNADILTFVGDHLSGEDRLFNDPTSGSWLIFFGVKPVFIDTRYDMYPKKLSEDVVYCIRGGPGWNTYLKDRGISHIVMRNDWPLITQALRESNDWFPLADNGSLTCWMRRSTENNKRCKNWQLSDETINESGLSEKLLKQTVQSRCRQYYSRAKISLQKKEFNTAVEDLRKAVALLPQSRFLHERLEEAVSLSSSSVSHRQHSYSL